MTDNYVFLAIKPIQTSEIILYRISYGQETNPENSEVTTP